MTGGFDEMPDTMSSDAIQEDNPCSLSHVRTQPAHPASDITALREAVTAAFSSQDPSLPQSLSGRSPHSLQTVSYMPPGRTNTSSSTGLPMHQIDLRHPLQADGQAAKRLTYDGGQPELPHYHPEAPGTPWVGSPVLEVPQDNLGAPQASPSIRVPTPASSGNHQAPFAADADHIRSSHERPAGSAILLSEQAPASLATADVIDDPVESASHGREGSQLSGRRDSTSTSMGQRWPSASEMSPEMLREYLATMEIPKPKPRPRRKHLDRKKELIRMKKELEDILIHRTALLKLEEARNVPPGAQIAADRLLQMHGLELRANQQYDVNTEEEGGHEVDSSRLSRPMSAQSTFQSESSQISPINSKDVNMHAIEEEIIDLNNEIERLMVSISELDKIKDPQIELSFTGPKTKNMQRARLDDELWTDITGRAPGIRRLSGFGTAYDTERTILTPAVSECSEVPTLSPMSSRSSLSIASTRSGISMRSSRSEAGHRLAHKISIMQTLAEAEDVEQQMNAGVAASADVTSGYIADEDQDDNSQAVTAGNVATGERSWRRDLEQWASSSSPPPQAIPSQFNQRFEHPNSPTSSSSSESRRPTSDSRISAKNRRISTSSITTAASSTISYLVTSPRAESAGGGGACSHESNEVGLSLHIPHSSQRGVPRKPPSSTRTRKEHIAAGLHGDEWSGHRSLNAELKAATAMQQKAAAAAAASAVSDSASPPSSASSRQNRQSTESPRSPARALSPIGATTTLRLTAETIASSVISAGHAIGIGAKEPDAALLHPEHPTTPAPRPEALSDAYPAAPPITDVPPQCSSIAPTPAAAPSAVSSSEQALPVPVVSAQSQRPGLRPTAAKRTKRANMTAQEIEQQRAKEAARKAKEQQKVARWHQRHLAIDAKKLFQSKKDELHNKLANTRHEDARAEVQWELGELYASYAWGEAGEHPDERDKPSLGAGALAHALRVMYEALCSASRREKGAVASITTDANKWARFAQLHMVMWSQGGGKTHFEWAIRAFNEAIKHCGDGTELTGAVCASAAQAIQAQAANQPDLMHRAVAYWQRSTKSDCSDNSRMAWRYVNLAHCYDVLTLNSMQQPDKPDDPAVYRGLCIDAIEKAHSLDPTNTSTAARLTYYKSCQGDEQESLEASGEYYDDDESDSRFSTSPGRSPGRLLGEDTGSSKYTYELEMVEDTFIQEETLHAEHSEDQTLVSRQPSHLTAGDTHECLEKDGSEAPQEVDGARDTTLTGPELSAHHRGRSRNRSPGSQHSSSPRVQAPPHSPSAPESEVPRSPALTALEYEGENFNTDMDAACLAYCTHKGEVELAEGDGHSTNRSLLFAEPRDGDPRPHTADPSPSSPRQRARQEEDYIARASSRSAPPHASSGRQLSDVAAQCGESSVAKSQHQHLEQEAFGSSHAFNLFRQYHHALENTNRRLMEVEAELRDGRTVYDTVRDLAARLHGVEERSTQNQQHLQELSGIRNRYDGEIQALRDSVGQLNARLHTLERYRSVPEPLECSHQQDEHTTRSPSPRIPSPRTIMRPSTTSSSYTRLRPASMMIDGEQRPRSVPPMHTGRTSVTGRSDDPPPSFHSRSNDDYQVRAHLDVGGVPARQPYFGMGESFDTFDKQAMLERGAMLFGLYSLHQLARQTGLQTPLFPQNDGASRQHQGP